MNLGDFVPIAMELHARLAFGVSIISKMTWEGFGRHPFLRLRAWRKCNGNGSGFECREYSDAGTGLLHTGVPARWALEWNKFVGVGHGKRSYLILLLTFNMTVTRRLISSSGGVFGIGTVSAKPAILAI